MRPLTTTSEVRMTLDSKAALGAHPQWWKSSYSSESANCVEVAKMAGGLAVRDSKNANGPVLMYGVSAWRDFISAVAGGAFDRPSGRNLH